MTSKDPNKKSKRSGIIDFLLKPMESSPASAKALEVIKKEIRRYKRLILWGAALILLGALLILPLPFIMGRIIDVVIPKRDVALLFISVSILLAFNVLGFMIDYLQALLFFKINNKMIIDVRMVLFRKLNNIPLAMFNKFGTGYLMSRITDEPPRLAALFGEQIIQQIKQLFVFLVSIFTLFYIDWRLACIAVIILPFFLYIVHHFGKKVKEQSELVFEKVSTNKKSLQENIDMVELCKLFNRESFNLRRYLTEIIKTYRTKVELKKIESLNSALLRFVGALLPMSVLGYGGYRIISGHFTVGMLVTFLSVLNNVVGPASSLVGFNIQIQKLKVALERVGEILTFPEEPDSAETLEIHQVNELSMHQVSFSYDPTKPVLKNITLEAKKGEKIGLTGPSGSGKTSLAMVISGLYHFLGEIIIDNSDIGMRSPKTLRKNVAIVPQEPILFSDSIYANVAFGRPGVSKKEVRDALERAHAWDFVEKLKDKEWTKVGDRGNTLSVGQKKRIAIARALIKNADILILDEATANIDNLSVKMITKALDEISKDKIVFIVSHDLETMVNCDKIAFLKDGKILEEGNHKELLAINGEYAHQFHSTILSHNTE